MKWIGDLLVVIPVLLIGTVRGTPPSNDNLANAGLLETGPEGSILFSSIEDATAEAGEFFHPEYAHLTPSRTVWYKIAAPAGGSKFTLTTEPESGGNLASTLSAYRGNQAQGVASLTAIVTNRGNGPGSIGSKVDFQVPQGNQQDYFISVDGTPVTEAKFILKIHAVPNNDNFATAKTLVATSGDDAANGDTYAATVEPGEIAHPAHLQEPFRTVWYRIPSPRTGGTFSLSMYQADFPARFSLFRGHAAGGLAGLVPVTGGNTSPVDVTVPNSTGGDYFVSVDSDADYEDSGSFTLRLIAPPPHDAFANAVLLEEDDFPPFCSNSRAGTEPGEQSHPNLPAAQRSLWYRIKAPPPGTNIELSTAFSNFDTIVTLYRGHLLNGIGILQVIDGDDDDGPGTTSLINFTVPDAAGLDYFIAVDGYAGATGTVDLSMTATAPPVVPAPPPPAFQASSAEPHELFTGGADSFDLEAHSITFMPHQVTVNGHPETHYRHTVRQIRELPEDLSDEVPEDNFSGDDLTATLPSGFSIFGQSATTAILRDSGDIEFQNAAQDSLIPKIRVLDSEANGPWRDNGLSRAISMRGSGEKVAIQYDYHPGFGVDDSGGIFHVTYQVEFFATGMIRISFLGIDDALSEGTTGLFNGALFPAESDFSAECFKMPDVVVAEAVGATATFQPKLAINAPQAVSMRATTADATAHQTLDYQARNTVEQIPAASSTINIPVPITSDSTPEAEEYFTLRLASPDDPNWIFAEARAWITDTAPPSPALAPRVELAGNRIFLTPPPGTGTVITGFRILAVTGGTVRLPSATTALPVGTIVTLAQGTEGLVASGPDVTLRVEAVNASGVSQGVASLDLDGTSGAPVFQFARETYDVTEGSTLEITVLASAPGGGVSYDLVAGTAQVSGTASDVVTSPRSLNFRDGRATLSIPVLADGLKEDSPPETFEVRLVNATPGSHLGPLAIARVTIQDGSGSLRSPEFQRFPVVQPSGRALRVLFDPDDFAGQTFDDSWRLAGETRWRDANENAFNLRDGLHHIEFRPAVGVSNSGYKNPTNLGRKPLFAAPHHYIDQGAWAGGLEGLEVDFRKDAPVEFGWPSNGQDPVPSPGYPVTGVLTVVPGLLPAGAQWRRIGETAWRNPSTTETAVPVGKHWIEFKDEVSGYFAPTPLPVEVNEGTIATLAASYRIRPSTAILPQVVTEPDLHVSSSSWLHVPIAEQTGHFGVSFEMQPLESPAGSSIDTLVGIASSPASSYNSLSAIVRANAGIFDGYKGIANSGGTGGVFGADAPLTFQVGRWHLVDMEVDVPGNNYRFTVTPPTGEPVEVIRHAGFRASATALRYLTLRSAAGIHQIRGIRVEPLGEETTYLSDNTWKNIPIGFLSGEAKISFDFKPLGSSIDTLVGFSDEAATSYLGYAAMLRAKSGVLDGWNGGAFGALTSLAYQAGKWYHVEFDLNITDKTYDLIVTPPNGTPVLLLDNAGFRDQATSLTHLSMRSEGGSHVIRRLRIDGSPFVEEGTADWTAIPIPVQTGSFEARFLVNLGLNLDSDNDDTPLRFGLSSGAAAAPTEPLAGIVHNLPNITYQTRAVTVTMEVNLVTKQYTLTILEIPGATVSGTLSPGFDEADHIYLATSELVGLKDMVLPPHEVLPSGPPPANDEDDWLHIAIPPQTGKFALTCEVVTKAETVLSGDLIDGIIGLSDSEVTELTDVSVRLRAKLPGGSGLWQAHTGAAGDGFSYENAVPVIDGKRYLVELVADASTDRYRATVRPDGGAPMVITSDAPFQKNATEIRYITLRNVQGRLAVSNIRTPLPAPEGAPVAFTGMIETSLGYASGVAVADHAVLTSARRVFDPAKLAFASDIVWRLPGSRVCPSPDLQYPSGVLLVAGYASALLADPAAGNAADAMDVAVLAFRPLSLPSHDHAPADGGYSGFAVDPGTAPWTAPGTQRLLAGFPMSNVTGDNRGKLHQANVTTATFTTVSTGLHAMTANFPDCAPGFEGASLFARQANGSYLPAAICLGTASGQLRFRTIDSAVADAIHQANTYQRQPLFYQELEKGGVYYIASTVAGTPDPVRSHIFSDAIPATAIWTLYKSNYDESDSLTSTGGQAVSLEPDDYYVAFGAPPPGYMIDPAQTFNHSTETSQHCLRKNLADVREWHLPPVYVPEPPKTWEEWQAQNFSVAERSRDSVIAPESTETFLGVENVIAYAFGFDPKISKTWHADPATMTPGYPILRRPSPTAPLQLEFLRRRDNGLRYRVEAADNLSGSWPWFLEAGYPNTSSSILTGASNDTWEHIRIPLTGLGPDTARKFVRVKVELANEPE